MGDPEPEQPLSSDDDRPEGPVKLSSLRMSGTLTEKKVTTDEEQGGDLKKSSSPSLQASKTFVATDPDKGLTDEQVEKARAEYGWNEIPKPETPLYMLFLHQFVGFLPFLIELAAIISAAVEDWTDFGIICGILLINGMLGFREEYHAKKSLDEVSNSIESEIAVRRNDGQTKQMPVKELVPGDIVMLVGGTVVPADVKWIRGDTMSMDTAPLTGEPLPRKYPSDDYGDVILSGTTVVAGECYGQVVSTGTDTEIGRAQADVLKDKSVRVVSVFQVKIMLVVQILVSSCLLVVLCVLLVQGILYGGFNTAAGVKDSILDALSILIASIPVALPLVVQVNLALGASFMAKEHHAIVTTVPALQDIASMSMLCSDKTGTLTTANMSIIPDQIYAGDGFTRTEVILYAYFCSNADKKDDPIDRAIVNAFGNDPDAKSKENDYRQTEIIGFNPSVKRVVAFVEHDGEIYTIGKGLPAKIIDTSAGAVDDHVCQWKVDTATDPEFMKTVTEKDRNLSKSGYKTIAIALCKGDARTNPDAVWKFVGLMPMLDPPREDTAATIESLHQANISVKMITGDHVNVGKETARLIGMGTDIRAGEEVRNAPAEEKKELCWNADGFAAVLPSDKREVVLTLRNEWGLVTGMTGDGVNDAPALSAAQVGIAVEGATDAAKNAADLILTEPGLSPIYGAVLESRRIFARIKAYVVYRVAASIMLVLTLSILIFDTGCAVDSLLIIILALLNDISMIPVAYDKASATTKPQIPNAQKIVLQSLFYGFAHTAGGLSFIFILDHVTTLKHPIDLEVCTPETRGFIWFHLVMVSELTIFSVRAPSFAWTTMPSVMLLGSVLLTCLGSAFIAVYASGLSWPNVGWIVLYNACSFLVVDLLKGPLRNAIGDATGDVIESDELVELKDPADKSESMRTMEKKMRYVEHQHARQDPSDLQHTIIIQDESPTFANKVRNMFGNLRPNNITNGFINRQYHGNANFNPASLSMSLRN